MHAQIVTKGKQLQHIINFDDKYLDKDIFVTIYVEDENYDTTNDPDWIMPWKDHDLRYQEAHRDLANGDVIDFEDFKKEFGYV